MTSEASYNGADCFTILPTRPTLDLERVLTPDALGVHGCLGMARRCDDLVVLTGAANAGGAV